MLFPNLHVPWLGDGMSIALVAVTHVVISHGFTIGVVALIVLLEHLSLSRADNEMNLLAQRMLKPAVIIITAVGAVTGAGIWFTVSALAPGGIGSLLRVFFWPWFIEWIAFALEVIVILVYYFQWDRMRERRPAAHVALGWIYVAIAVASAFLITGILGFMLTPDGWVQHHRLLPAFFNPTFWPQLALRLLGGLTLGGLFSMGFVLFTRRISRDLQRRTTRLFGGWVLAAGLLCAPAVWVYFGRVPRTYATHTVFAVLTSQLSQSPWLLTAGNIFGAVLIAAAGIAALFGGRLAARILVIPALLAAIGLTAEYERVREFIRGPYLMPGYMYANQITLAESVNFQRNGYLAQAAWYQPQSAGDAVGAGEQSRAGHALFMANCGVCHTIGGINDIRDRLRGRTLSGVNVLIGRTHQMVPFMPPFSGNEAERLSMAAYLYGIGREEQVADDEWADGKEGAHE